MQAHELVEAAAKVAGNQARLAELLGVPDSWVSNWKNGTGNRRPQPEDIALLAHIAGLDPADALIRAVLEQSKGTKRGERLAAALGKSLRATGAKVTGLTSIAAALVGTGLMSIGAIAERATMYRSVKSRGPLLSFQP